MAPAVAEEPLPTGKLSRGRGARRQAAPSPGAAKQGRGRRSGENAAPANCKRQQQEQEQQQQQRGGPPKPLAPRWSAAAPPSEPWERDLRVRGLAPPRPLSPLRAPDADAAAPALSRLPTPREHSLAEPPPCAQGFHPGLQPPPPLHIPGMPPLQLASPSAPSRASAPVGPAPARKNSYACPSMLPVETYAGGPPPANVQPHVALARHWSLGEQPLGLTAARSATTSPRPGSRCPAEQRSASPCPSSLQTRAAVAAFQPGAPRQASPFKGFGAAQSNAGSPMPSCREAYGAWTPYGAAQSGYRTPSTDCGPEQPALLLAFPSRSNSSSSGMLPGTVYYPPSREGSPLPAARFVATPVSPTPTRRNMYAEAPVYNLPLTARTHSPMVSNRPCTGGPMQSLAMLPQGTSSSAISSPRWTPTEPKLPSGMPPMPLFQQHGGSDALGAAWADPGGAFRGQRCWTPLGSSRPASAESAVLAAALTAR